MQNKSEKESYKAKAPTQKELAAFVTCSIIVAIIMSYTVVFNADNTQYVQDMIIRGSLVIGLLSLMGTTIGLFIKSDKVRRSVIGTTTVILGVCIVSIMIAVGANMQGTVIRKLS